MESNQLLSKRYKAIIGANRNFKTHKSFAGAPNFRPYMQPDYLVITLPYLKIPFFPLFIWIPKKPLKRLRNQLLKCRHLSAILRMLGVRIGQISRSARTGLLGGACDKIAGILVRTTSAVRELWTTPMCHRVCTETRQLIVLILLSQRFKGHLPSLTKPWTHALPLRGAPGSILQVEVSMGFRQCEICVDQIYENF